MSVSAFSIDALKAMAAKGLSLADVIEIGEAMGIKRSSAAIRQARYRNKKHNERDVTSDVKSIPNEDTSNPAPSEPNGSSGDDPPAKSKKQRSFEFETPDWFNSDELEAWTAFARMRYRRKKPLDDYTAKQLFGRLRSIADAGWNIVDVMVKATVHQHDGFWMPDGRDSNVRKANEPRAGPVDMDEYKQRLARIGHEATH